MAFAPPPRAEGEAFVIIDSHDLPDGETVETDVCIIGAGAAGIALAREFKGQAFRVSVVESGGLELDASVDALNAGENAGPYPVNIESRNRCLGGSTASWGGNCAPMDPIDFEPREYNPLAVWPIAHAELEQYNERVCDLVGLDSSQFQPDTLAKENPEFTAKRIGLPGPAVTTKVFYRNRNQFGQTFRDELAEQESNVRVYLNATATKLETNKTGGVVTRVQLGGLDGKRFHIQAGYFVLAAGIENARLLLLSRDSHEQGLGNHHDRVGRYFMSHLLFMSGLMIPARPDLNVEFYDVPFHAEQVNMDHVRMFGGLQINPELQYQHKLLNYVAFITKLHRHTPMLTKRIIAHYNHVMKNNNIRVVHGIRHFVEQAPSETNRIMLSDDRDALGLPKLRMEWTISELEKRTLHQSLAMLNAEFRRHRLGMIRSDLPAVEAQWPGDLATESLHFMGSTRMSDDPRTGVVDAHCRVHEVANLYVAGGSVIPSGGATMVTFNILALALRLADHLKAEIVKPG